MVSLRDAGTAAPPRTSPTSQALEPIIRRLAASLAHNINNALTGVLGYTQLALLEVAPGTVLHDRLQGSLDCTLKVAETVRRLSTYAFRPAERGTLELVALHQVAEDNVQRLLGQSPRPLLTVTVQADAPGWVRASRPLLRLALDQLLANALEAMPGGGTLGVRVWEDGTRCRLSVTDSGPGLCPEVEERLFEPFLTTKCAGHVGLGLVLCRDVIEALGGAVEVVSVPGQGTAVTLSLPAADPIADERDVVADCVALSRHDGPDRANAEPAGRASAVGMPHLSNYSI